MRAYNPPRIRCGQLARYGGLSAARKGSRADLGVMWHCNRPVKNEGDKCWQHQRIAWDKPNTEDEE